jgi:archaellum component FlaC
MKTMIFFSILFCAIALSALAELTDADLDKIRLIVNEEVKKEIATTNKKIEGLDTRLRSVEEDISFVRGKIEGTDKQTSLITNFVYGMIALIVAVIAIPQLIMAWRSGKDRSLERQIETLTQEIETLKQQRIVNP